MISLDAVNKEGAGIESEPALTERLSEATTATHEYPSRAASWIFLILLVLLAITATIDRQAISVLVEPIKNDLEVTDVQIGWLSSIFVVFHALVGLPIAWLADRRSRKHIIAIGVFFWSMAMTLCGLASNFWTLFLARIGVGVGEASLTPSATSLVADYFPRARIPLAMSIFLSGQVLGAGLGYIVTSQVFQFAQQSGAPPVPLLSHLEPWQLTFVYLGLPGVILAVLALMVIREPQRRHSAPVANHMGLRAVAGFYRQNRATLLLHHAGFLAFLIATHGVNFWTVAYFMRVHALDVSTAAQMFGMIYLFSGTLGPIAAAAIAERLSRSGRLDANIRVAAMTGAVASVCVMLALSSASAGLAFLFFVPAVFLLVAPSGLAYGSLPVISPPHMRAVVSAVYLVVTAIAGTAGPVIAGAFNDHLFSQPTGIRFSLMTLTVLFGVTGLILLNLCRRPYAKSIADANRVAQESSVAHLPPRR